MGERFGLEKKGHTQTHYFQRDVGTHQGTPEEIPTFTLTHKRGERAPNSKTNTSNSTQLGKGWIKRKEEKQEKKPQQRRILEK